MSTDPGFGDAEARRIIQRAAEIDAQRSQSLDAKALHEIAEEAGISPAAVDQAIRERLEPAVTRRPWAVRYRGLLISIGLLFALMVARFLFPPTIP
jgi:hypothetical protein